MIRSDYISFWEYYKITYQGSKADLLRIYFKITLRYKDIRK